MESQLKTLSNQHVATALAMVGIGVKENIAGLIQDTIHSLIEMGDQFDLMTASKLVVKHKFEPDNTLTKLKAQYAVLSELYDPKSNHKTQRKMGNMIDELLKQIESYKIS
jgi:hypothetical protein